MSGSNNCLFWLNFNSELAASPRARIVETAGSTRNELTTPHFVGCDHLLPNSF
jgi:hypothetical protein